MGLFSFLRRGTSAVSDERPARDDRRGKPRKDPHVGTRILIIDDSATIVKALAAMLARDNKYVVRDARDAETGLKMALSEMPDLIFLDLVLPGMSGFEALRKLRKFARTGSPDELDLEDTIRSTARNAGWLDLKMVPERHNAVKVLLFFDIGGSMDDHIRVCEQLFSASRNEFKHLEYFYFHNFLYERVWKDNRRRHTERVFTHDVLRTYAHDYKVIFVGDATMSPYEITFPGGSVEHTNEEPGAVWMQRVLDVYPNTIWINPQNESLWDYHESIRITRGIMSQRMFPLTIDGLDRGMRMLLRRI